MLQSIFKQLWNCKENNIWLVLELLIVFCLIWYMVDYMFVLSYNKSTPDHKNLHHAWLINISEYQNNQRNYQETENDPESRMANFERIIQTLRNNPGVEAVAISFNQSYPGTGSTWNYSFQTKKDSTSGYTGQLVMFDPRYDFFRVFGYSKENGKKEVSVSDFNWSAVRNVVLSRSAADVLFPDEQPEGQEIYLSHNWNEPYKVAGIIDNVKLFDFLRPQYNYYTSMLLTAENIKNAHISVRSKPTVSDKMFKENFQKETAKLLNKGNFYFKSIASHQYINDNSSTVKEISKEIQLRVSLMIFFLLNILLCILGTFWYQVNQRKGEIGIRKAIGASNRNINKSLILESLCLLAIAMIPALLIEYQFVHRGILETLGTESNFIAGEYLPDKKFLRFLITNFITGCIMAVIIIIAIWVPAKKSSRYGTGRSNKI
ncbi:MAG: ABC transporter permease [Bacteroidales bacterium]|nr:ABC transporter permease [Bacteroidales bacterium]